jgi:hypothetical protein
MGLGKAQPAQRPVVEQEQHERQGHQRRLAHQAQGEEEEGESVEE